MIQLLLMRKYIVSIAIMLAVFPAWGLAEEGLSIAPSARFLFIDGRPTGLLGPVGDASSHSLVYNNEGITPEEGFNLFLTVSLKQDLSPLEMTLEPLYTTHGEPHGRLHKGYLRYKGDYFNFDVGKESLWWGQGVHGSLFLSNNAQPLPMIRLFNPKPYGLPYLGPFRFDFFISQLEADRVIPKPYFQGTRIALQPHSMLEVGFTRTIIMGGEGRPSLSPSRFWNIWFGENKEHDDDQSNSLAGIDFALTLPTLRFYGEVGGEDEAGHLPSHGAFLAGIYFQKGGLFQKDFRMEYAHITHPAWYGHSVYQSGYTYKKKILGHHVGGAAQDIYLEQGVLDREGMRGKVTLDYEERGVDIRAFRERHYQVGTNWAYQAGTVVIPWTVQTDVLYEWVRDVAYQSGVHQEDALVSFTFVGKL
jgi:hypothetical protein